MQQHTDFFDMLQLPEAELIEARRILSELAAAKLAEDDCACGADYWRAEIRVLETELGLLKAVRTAALRNQRERGTRFEQDPVFILVSTLTTLIREHEEELRCARVCLERSAD